MKNKIKYNWIWLVAISFVALEANPIAVEVAKDNALKWMKSKNHQDYTIKKEVITKNSTKTRTKKKPSKYKILELEPKGWVIVSLDDVIKPIVGYGDSKIDINNIPPALTEYLEDIEKTIDYRNAHVKASKNKSSKELLYSANNNEYIVRPLLWLGSTVDTEEQGIVWGQGRTTPPEDGYTYTESNHYNVLTPEWEPGNHTYTGCVATAMGQIMRYWKYPSVGTGENRYTPRTHPEYGEQYVNFAATTYDWENMPLTLTSENYDVAQILYHAGVAVNMNYTRSGSGAYFGDQMRTYFSYKMRGVFSRGEDMDISVKEFLNLDIPLIVSGRNNSSGHLYIVDGYDGDGYYHFNWGWNGMSNGKYTLESGTWGFVSNEFTAVAPVDPSAQVTIADNNFSSCIVEQLSLGNSSEIKELSLKYTDNLDCSENNISSVEELSYFKYVRSLYLQDNNLHGTLDLSNRTHLYQVDISDNNISALLLPSKESGYNFISLGSNQNLNILEIENLKNIEHLSAYGTESLACWQVNALKVENNITNINMGCSNTASDNLDTDGDGISNLDDPDDDNDGINDLVDDDIDGDGVLNAEDEFPLDASKSAYPELLLEHNISGTVEINVFDYYKLHVTAGQKIRITLGGLSSDLDLYVKVGEIPTPSTKDCSSASGGTSEEECLIDIASDADLYIGVYGYTSGSYELLATQILDTDGDGISNDTDTDDDNDGVLDSQDAFPLDASESVDTDGDGIGNNADTDDDNDGISDVDETAWGLNPLNAGDGANVDSDGDGVSNADEIAAGSDPLDASDTPKRFVPIMMDDMVIMVPLVD